MNKLDKTYTDLLQDILDNGVTKSDRTGTGTISVFGRQIRHKMSDGFPLITTKRIKFGLIVTELLWFLRGDTNIKFLVDNGCHIWDGDCYQAYVRKHKHAIRTGDNRSEIAMQILEEQLICSKEEFIERIKTDNEFAKKFGELGPIYGKQWRSLENHKELARLKNAQDGSLPQGIYDITYIDQIANLINDLKTNPDSRRLMVSAWNPGEIDQCVLPPCHYGFQVYTRELSLTERRNLVTLEVFESVYNGGDSNSLSHSEIDQWGYPTRAISLMWNQRSCDTFLGIPFNIASYGLLLEILAKEVNMVPDELIGNLGDVHLYSNHIEQATDQIGRELSLDERIELASKDPVFDPGDFGVGEQVTDEHCHEICDAYLIPRRSRTPYKLPTLKLPKTDEFWNGFDVSLFGHLEPTDFTIENYQSHPTIKAPLSN